MDKEECKNTLEHVRQKDGPKGAWGRGNDYLAIVSTTLSKMSISRHLFFIREPCD